MPPPVRTVRRSLLGSFGGNSLAQRLGSDIEFAGGFMLALGAEGPPRSLAAAGSAGLVGHGDLLSCGTGLAKSGVHSTSVGPA